MRISLCQTKTFKCSDPLVQDRLKRLVIWWYGPIIKNFDAGSIPKVIIFVREIDDSDVLGEIFQREAALLHLGLLRIGTVWHAGESTKRIKYQELEFDLSFTTTKWSLTSPYETAPNSPNPIPRDEYPLLYPKDRNYLLDFKLGDGKNLLVPCMEFFIRCYGRSAEIKRILTICRWEKASGELFLPLDFVAEPDTWPVKLTERLRDADAVFVAHVIHDPFATKAAKAIYAQIEVEGYGTSRSPHRFLKCTPWFSGDAKLAVSGFWINGGKTFLGLRIDGCSEPKGKPILLDRQNSNLTDDSAPSTSDDAEKRSDPPRRIATSPEVANLVDDREPDHGSSSIEILEDDFKTLGPPREVNKVRRARQGGGAPARSKPTGRDSGYSAGERYGTGKGVGHASIKAPASLESHGVLRDMWNALLKLKDAYPNIIRSVEWFTFEDGFNSANDHRLIPLKIFKPGEGGAKTSQKNWVFLNGSQKTPRGVLFVRIQTPNKNGYLFEIQRGEQKKTDANNKTITREENFKGLVLTLDDESRLKERLHELLDKVRYEVGIVSRLVENTSESGFAFTHKSSKEYKLPQEAAVRRALGMIGIKLPKAKQGA